MQTKSVGCACHAKSQNKIVATGKCPSSCKCGCKSGGKCTCHDSVDKQYKKQFTPMIDSKYGSFFPYLQKKQKTIDDFALVKNRGADNIIGMTYYPIFKQ